MKKQPDPQHNQTAHLRAATRQEAPQIAQMVYLCGPKLLSLAFGPSQEEAIRCITTLASSGMTMFSFQFARVASLGDSKELAGLVIGMPYEDYVQSERRLAAITFRQKGLWRWLRLIPLAIELSRCAEPLSTDSYYISALSVGKPWRRQGIGVQLIDYCLHQAAESGAKRIVLDVEMDNEPAQRLYRRMGFTLVSETLAGRRMRRQGIVGLRRMQRVL